MHLAPIWVLAAWFTVFVAKFGFVGAQFRDGGYDNKHPREQQARMEGSAKRALAAHANGFENFGPFAAGMLFAFATGVPTNTVNMLGGAYVAIRLVYNLLYIANMSTLRSLVWGLGAASTIGLYLSAFLKLRG